jgi:hypothetical protein
VFSARSASSSGVATSARNASRFASGRCAIRASSHAASSLVGALRPSFDDLGDQLGVARDLEELLLHVALVGREELPEALARALLLAYQVGKHVRLGHGLERVARGRLVVEGQRLDRGLVGLVEGADRGGWRGRGGEKECGQCECGGAHDSTLRLERLRAI